MGVATAMQLPQRGARGDEKVLVAGTVTHRQRPMTAQGITFINLEDETGHINVVCSVGCWARYRKVARGAGALLVRGRLEVGDGGVINVVAEHIAPLHVAAKVAARNFR
jgi:error-prone DNA polymerase